MGRNRIIIFLLLSAVLRPQADTTVTVSGESASFTVDAADPAVDWFYPNGGEQFDVNSAFIGSWSANDEGFGPAPITIVFCYTIGGDPVPVAAGLPNSGSTNLISPAQATPFLRIGIWATDLFGNVGADFSQGYITIGETGGDTTVYLAGESPNFTSDSQDPTVICLTPNGGESYSSGASITCTWEATDAGLASLPIVIGATPAIGDQIYWLTADIANSGVINVTLPVADTRFARCFVLAKDQFGNQSWDGSDGYFTIGSPVLPPDTTAVFAASSADFACDAADPVVDLLVPNGGETYLEGSDLTVEWTATDDNFISLPIRIYAAAGIGAVFEQQTDYIANSGSAVITAPDGPQQYGQARIIAEDQFGNSSQDQSQGYFSVFETGTGALRGYLSAERDIDGTLYRFLWQPGHDPTSAPPDTEQTPAAVSLIAGENRLYSFANLAPGSGYTVGAFIDQAGSEHSGADQCDYSYDLSGYSTAITVLTDLVTEGADIALHDCGDFDNGNFSLSFDGTDDYVEIPDAASLNPDTVFTVCVWLYPQAWGGNNRVLQKGLGDDQYLLEAEDDIFEFVLNSQDHSAAMPLPPVNTWSFISGVYDNDSLRLFYNGQQRAAAPLSGALNVTTDPLRFWPHPGPAARG